MARSAGQVEKEYENTITDALDLFGYHGIHVFPLQGRDGIWRTPTTSPGWPDLVYLRGPRLLAIEVKVDGVTVPPQQRAWLSMFAQIPCARAWVVRPSDPPWDLLTEWIRRPQPAPRSYGFKLVENPGDALDKHKEAKRRRKTAQRRRPR